MEQIKKSEDSGDKLSHYKIARELFKIIDYSKFTKINENNNDTKCPYNGSGFQSNPLIHYLNEVAEYNSHASGDYDDFGILKKSIFGIPSGRYVKLEILDTDTFKITWIVEDVDDVLTKLMDYVDYDFRVFDKIGFTKKYKIIKLNFKVSEENDLEPDNQIINSGLLNYKDILNSNK
jgi:hypothetical protein